MSILENHYQRVAAKNNTDKEILKAVYKYWNSHNYPAAEALYQSDNLQEDGLELVGNLLEILEKSR
jgi:hypothetical protein